MKNGWKFNIFKLYKVLNKCNVKFNYLFDFWLKQILCCHLTRSKFRVEPGQLNWWNIRLFICGRGFESNAGLALKFHL